MTFNQINYFLAVGKYLNFTQAASALFVTQSTLSRSVASLETELGVKLLERDFHTVKLTPAGEIMYQEMKDIMAMINGLIRRVQSTENMTSNKFAIGILESQQIDAKVLLTLRNLSDKYPQFSMDVKRMGYQELIAEIKANRIDIAEVVLTDDTEIDDEIGCQPIRQVENYLVAKNDDAVWNTEADLSAIDGRNLVLLEQSHPGIERIKRAITVANLRPVYKEASDMETLSLWLEAGMGLTVCNGNDQIYASRSFRPVKCKLLPELENTTIALLWNKGYPSPMVDEFLMFIRSGLSDDISEL